MDFADNPIRRPKDDLLDRKGYAKSFARQVLVLDASEGTTARNADAKRRGPGIASVLKQVADRRRVASRSGARRCPVGSNWTAQKKRGHPRVKSMTGSGSCDAVGQPMLRTDRPGRAIASAVYRRCKNAPREAFG